MKCRIVCENLRSAYNVGNIFRTADALGRGVVLAGYTAREDHKGVRKTALGAEQSVPLQTFDDLEKCYTTITTSGLLIAAELDTTSVELREFVTSLSTQEKKPQEIYLVLGNEVTGIEESTIERADHTIAITMQGIKKSLNVGQAAAICMREFNKL